MYANPAGANAPADSAVVVEFLIDGKPVEMTYNGVYYPKGVARKDAGGKEYQAYEGTVSFTGWLSYTETRDTKVVSVRVKVTATDGKTCRKETAVAAVEQ